MTLGENLKRLRTEKGLSQEEVAGQLFLSRQTGSLSLCPIHGMQRMDRTAEPIITAGPVGMRQNWNPRRGNRQIGFIWNLTGQIQ